MTGITMNPRRLARVRDALESALDDGEHMDAAEFQACGELLQAMEIEAERGNTVRLRIEIELLSADSL